MLDWFKRTRLSVKVLTIGALMVVLSFGLCGVAFNLVAPHSQAVGALSVSGGYLFLIGAASILLGLLLLVVENLR